MAPVTDMLLYDIIRLLILMHQYVSSVLLFELLIVTYFPVVPNLGVRSLPKGHNINLRGGEMINGVRNIFSVADFPEIRLKFVLYLDGNMGQGAPTKHYFLVRGHKPNVWEFLSF